MYIYSGWIYIYVCVCVYPPLFRLFSLFLFSLSTLCCTAKAQPKKSHNFGQLYDPTWLQQPENVCRGRAARRGPPVTISSFLFFSVCFPITSAFLWAGRQAGRQASGPKFSAVAIQTLWWIERSTENGNNYRHGVVEKKSFGVWTFWNMAWRQPAYRLDP